MPDPSTSTQTAPPENATEQNATDALAEEFGANDWLLEEMYEQYVSDPASVDPSWAQYFKTHQLSGGSKGAGGNGAAAAKPAGGSSPSAPKAESAPAPTPSKPSSAPATKQTAPPAPAPSSPSKTTPAPAAPAARRPATVEKPTANKNERPSAPGKRGGVPADPPNPSNRPNVDLEEPVKTILRGAPARTAKNMDASLTVPTATSVRSLPVKLLIDQRVVINNHLRRARGGKVSYTHLIGYAMVQALKTHPEMNKGYDIVDGKPTMIEPRHINLGLAIDLPKPDGTRQLLVPSIKSCENLDFAQFWAAYEEVVKKARSNSLTVQDFAGTTITLTNPGTIGTNHSVPRLMLGQGAIIGVGSMDYPPEFQGSDPDKLSQMSVSKVMTLTSTYDHRVIQGAQSGQYLARLHALLLGEDGFYDDVFSALRIPYEPIRWAQDVSADHEDQVSKQARVFEMINAYRVRGHLMADTDPLEYRQRSHHDLDVQTHSLTLWDLDREFATGSFAGGQGLMKMRKILGILRDSYCRTIGIEYMHIQEPAQRKWIQDRVERPHESLPREEHLRILDRLNEAEIFETFLQTKFVGQKRFSLEGGESAIVVLDEVCEQAADHGLEEVCIGMPHRGRLNVLANIVGKSYAQIFREFEGNIDPRTVQGSGDVKYHLGAEGKFSSLAGATIKTSVAANPSHLEAVNPVLEGIARAKQDILDRGGEFPVLPVLMHGDAAFAGQGVVAETLNLSQLRGYRTGGTIHIIVNNQVGFTTSPAESRSSMYCTDVARMIQAPIFHVNGDDPEACVRVARLAFAFRQEFNKDVVLDIVCYRRRGHNEGDDPSFTQPLMYDLIEKKRSTRKLYTEALIGRGDITIEDAEEVMSRFQQRLESVFREVRDANQTPDPHQLVPAYPSKEAAPHGTAVSMETLKKIADAHITFPDGFSVHPKVMPQLQRRSAAITQGGIDWGTAEILAFGSLLMEGRTVRLTGQDSRRGTFVQRFASVVDRKTGEAYVPLKHLEDDQGKFHIFDSLLSEYAAMGFEYGYSVARPDALVLWEAQFGDFANGAQTIIDEFISSGQAKWTQKSGVTLLLPHGFEGQGPDHSSARIERWLQLAAEDSIAVAQPSTPASHFHLLRQHAIGERHRPLVIMTPKSMLRNKLAVSQPADFTDDRWRPVLTDPFVSEPEAINRVVLCSGKVRWDLVNKRAQLDRWDTAIVPLERLYPLPAEEIGAELRRYPNAGAELLWVQDEPANQGPWPFMALNLTEALRAAEPGQQWTVRPITRPASSAPSVGSAKVHEAQQRELLESAFR